MAKIEIGKIKISKDEILGIPEDERKQFLLASCLVNDIHHILDISRVSLLQKSKNNIMDEHYKSQVIFVVTLLIGKLKEGHEIFRKNFHSTESSKEYLSSLNPESKEFVKEINTGFNKNRWFKEIRNKISFHYDDDEVIGIFNDLNPEEKLCFYLSDYGLNQFSTIHSALLHGMLNKIDSSNLDESVLVLNTEIKRLSVKMLRFFGDYIDFVIQKYFEGVERKESVEIPEEENKVKVEFFRFVDEEILKDWGKGIKD